MAIDPQRFINTDSDARHPSVSDIARHTYSMSNTGTISPDGVMRIDAPSHLIDHMDDHTGFEFSSDALSDPDYDQGGGKGLVLWMKRDFWNPAEGSYHDCQKTLQADADALTAYLAEKYDLHLNCYMFSDEIIEKSGTPSAIIITGDLAAQEKLHHDIRLELAAAVRKERQSNTGHGGPA